MPALPSWIQGADPARYAAEGLRIGDSEREAQMESQQHAEAAARAQQQLQMRQQVLEAQATAAAQKHQAQQGYQQAISQGMDPTQAILKFGPMMGAGGAVGSALRLAQPKAPPTPPAIQMMPGPDGTQIPVLVQGGRGTVVPRTAYQAPAAPEQFKPAVRQINGRDVQGQESSKTGRFIPFPSADQSGTVSPPQRLQIGIAQKKKTALEKTLADESQLLALAKKRANGKTPTHADLEAVETDLRRQSADLDGQISQLSGLEGSGNVPRGVPDFPAAPAASERKTGQTYMTPRGPHTWNGSGWVVPDDANADSDSQ
jgi:hypothetical protein